MIKIVLKNASLAFAYDEKNNKIGICSDDIDYFSDLCLITFKIHYYLLHNNCEGVQSIKSNTYLAPKVRITEYCLFRFKDTLNIALNEPFVKLSDFKRYGNLITKFTVCDLEKLSINLEDNCDLKFSGICQYCHQTVKKEIMSYDLPS